MNINKMVDLTYLKEGSTEKLVEFLEKAVEFNPYSVCVLPTDVEYVADDFELNDIDIKICTVIGFPTGNHTVESKCFEAKCATENGADEIDYVINRSFVRDNDWDNLANEAKQIKDIVGWSTKKTDDDIIVKAIIEISEFTLEEIEKISETIGDKVDFLKTSTGFSKSGATVEAVKIMAKYGKVKASGGIRTFEDAQKMIDAGASRIGASGLTGEANEY